MGTLLLIACLGAALNLALWGALYRKLDDLPVTLRAQARRERTEAEAQALTALRDAATASVGAITASLRAHEEDAAVRHIDEVAAAELRARMAERRGSDAVPVLGTASDLVRQLRATLERLDAAAGKRTVPPPPAPAPETRPTLEMGPPASCAPPPLQAGEDEPEEELTTFYDAPAGGALHPVIRPPPAHESATDPVEVRP